MNNRWLSLCLLGKKSLTEFDHNDAAQIFRSILYPDLIEVFDYDGSKDSLGRLNKLFFLSGEQKRGSIFFIHNDIVSGYYSFHGYILEDSGNINVLKCINLQGSQSPDHLKRFAFALKEKLGGELLILQSDQGPTKDSLTMITDFYTDIAKVADSIQNATNDHE